MSRRRVLVFGLDAATPALVRRWLDQLPTFRAISQAGILTRLRSTVPPITVPAWLSMMTGKDPGTLGIYGFTDRQVGSYDEALMASSARLREHALWDVAGLHDRQSVVIGVPATYPPKPLKGALVTGMLTPGPDACYTYPPGLRGRIEALVGGYLFDASGFRLEERGKLLQDIHEMTTKRFQVADMLLESCEWDLFIMVEVGLDRLQHAFWQYFDVDHVLYRPGSQYADAVPGYYCLLDRLISEILQKHAADDDLVLLVSDHGARPMQGGFCLNDWLIQAGYLVLTEEPQGPVPFDSVTVDWDKTVAWGAGGYCGRLFLNVKGREPKGVLPPSEVESLLAEISSKLQALKNGDGRPMGNTTLRPEEVYTTCRGVPPDLIIYFGELSWRSIGSVGHRSLFTRLNDIGPDGANHDRYGLFAAAVVGDMRRGVSRTDSLKPALGILDVAPTVLKYMGIPISSTMPGRAVCFI